MKTKRKEKKENVNNKIDMKPSKEYTTAELLELGKKTNVLKLARPLYEENAVDNKEQES